MDYWLLRQKIAMIGVVAAQWFLALAAPAMLLGYLESPRGWTAALLLAMTGYCFFTGYRAWKRGWKSRFVLRLIVPGCLLVLSCVGFGIAKWVQM
jgi:Mn2+/Fe2+ NRAMP family transporter